MSSTARAANHERFISHLAESEPALWAVAQFLHRRGETITVPPVSRAPTWEERVQHLDNGDLFISRGADALRVEVKGRGLQFTCAADFPYPSIIVCARHTWDQAKPKPFVYYNVNAALTHAATIHFDMRPHWYEGIYTDKRYTPPIVSEAYYCPLEKLRFVDLRT